MRNVKQYRADYPEQTQHLSDFELATELHNRYGDGKPFDEFSREFLGTTAPAVDHTPQPKPYKEGKGMIERAEERFDRISAEAGAAWYGGWGGVFRNFDNIAKFNRDWQDEFFGYHLTYGGGFDKAATYMLEKHEELLKIAQEKGPKFADEAIGSAVGGVIPGAFEFMQRVPMAAWRGAAKAHAEGNSELKGAVKEGLKQFTLQKIFGWAGKFGKPTAAAVNSTVFGVETALEGGDRREIAKSMAVGVMLAGLHKKRTAPAKVGEMEIETELPVKAAEKVLKEEGLPAEEAPAPKPVELDKLGTIIDAPADRRTESRGTDRRNQELRKKRSEEMTREELIALRKTNPLTNHQNGIAYEEATKLPFQVVSDVNNLKWYNTEFGMKGGDAVINAKAAALRRAGLTEDSYHLHGDEFVVQFKSEAEAKAAMDKANRFLAETEVEVTDKDGNPVLLKGLRFTYGVGENLDAANFKFEETKAGEKAAGLRVERDGKPAGLTIRPLAEAKPEPKVDKVSGRRTREELEADEEFKTTVNEIVDVVRQYGDGAVTKLHENPLLRAVFRSSHTPEGARQLIDAIAEKSREESAKRRGNVRSLEEIEGRSVKLLEDLGQDGQALGKLKRLYKDASDIEERLVSAKMYFEHRARLVDELYKKSESPTATELDHMKFMQEVAYLEEIEPLITGSISHVARATTAGRIKIGGQQVALADMTPEFLEASLEGQVKLKEVFQRMGGKDALDRIKKNWEKNAPLKDKIKYVKKLRGSKFMNALLEFRAANMLSSLNTQIVNTTSNIAHLTKEAGENYITAAIGKWRGDAERITLQEANLRAYGILSGMWRGFVVDPLLALKDLPSSLAKPDRLKRFEKWAESRGVDPYVRAEAENITPAAISREYLEESTFGRALNTVTGNSTISDIAWKMVDTYGRVARSTSFGLMNISDSTIKNITYDVEVRGSLLRKAIQDGVPAEIRAEWIDRQHQLVNSYREGVKIEAPRENMEYIIGLHKQALAKARYIAWQEEFGNEGFQKRFEQALKETPSARLIFPFYKTPMNLLKFVPRHTPGLHRLSRVVMEDINAGGVRRAQAHARLVSGTMMWLGAAALWQSGIVTGGHDPKERQAMQDAGIQEYSWQVGETLIQYNRTDPFGMFIGIVTDLGNIIDRMGDDDYKAQEIAASVVLALSQDVMSKTYFTTLGDLMLAVRDWPRYGEAFLKRYAGSFLPQSGLMRSVSSLIDENMREADTLMNTLRSVYFSPSAPVKLDDFGEEVPKHWRFLGVSTNKPRTDSPVRMEMAFLHIPTMLPKDQSMGVDLDAKQYYEFKKILSRDLQMEKRMNEVVTGPSYPENFEVRKEILTGLRSAFHEAARGMLFAKDEEVRTKWREQLDRKVALLTRQPNTNWQDGNLNWRQFLAPRNVK